MKEFLIDSQVESFFEEASADYKHPLLTVIRFVFADDKPNANGQGIKYEDFEDIKLSAVDMPIKMKYMGSYGIGGHTGAVSIGHIRGMSEETLEDGTNRLIAEGVLYAQEFPDEVEFIRDQYASGMPPGISWEVSYKDEVKEGPVSWLKGIITRAATFVRNPAYGARTALLALASDQSISEEELLQGISAITQELSPKNEDKGGSNKVEEELTNVKTELETKTKEIETLLAAKAELEAKVAAQEEVINTFKKNTLIGERTAKVQSAGLKIESDPDKLAQKQEFWAAMSEEAFDQYLDDLTTVQSAAATKTASAAVAPTISLPRVEVETDVAVSADELKNRFRGLSRP